MLMNYFKMMISMNLSLMMILFTSMFFFQNNHFKTKILWKKNISKLGIKHNILFKKFKNKKSLFSILLKNLAFLSLFPLTLSILFNSPSIMISLFKWIPKKSFKIKLELKFDQKFKSFFSMALFVSWSIIQFSLYYMPHSPKPKNFFRLLIMFLLKMILLTTSKNIFMLFIGWEGVGFLSFLLISWWFTRNKANTSAMQAMMYKRIGDMGLLLFFSMSLSNLNSWSLSEIASFSKYYYPSYNILFLSILIAAMGKSAQFGLHPWLPAAMEGPTPVSALLHSSTMVVAGMFLLIRISPLFNNLTFFKKWCLLIGSMTALFAASTAITQYDMKKMMAYSTTSQLGLMMVAMGLNQPNIALFHICTHAFFKAMLFLSSGSIIHKMKNEQDLRKMGGLQFLLPNTSACILLGSLALSGIPFLAGFYSKDLIMEMSLTNMSNLISILLVLVATLLTPLYSLRMIFFCFLSPPSFLPLPSTKENKYKLNNALKRLAIGTMLSGWFMSTFIIQTPIIITSLMLKSTAFIISLTGLFLSLLLLHHFSKSMFSNYYTLWYKFFSSQWFFDKLFHIKSLFYSFSYSLFLKTRNMDQGWKEKINPHGISKISTKTSQIYQYSQTAYMKQYLISSITYFISMLFMIFMSLSFY